MPAPPSLLLPIRTSVTWVRQENTGPKKMKTSLQTLKMMILHLDRSKIGLSEGHE